jgi:hypothetical protein
MNRVFLREANMMMNFRASCYFRDFDMGAMNSLVSNTTNVSLTALDLSQLFNKRFAIVPSITPFNLIPYLSNM